MPHLYYVHDPMCSWCWAFRPTLKKLLHKLPDSTTYSYLLGGLAPDSDQPMAPEMREKLMSIWKDIQKKLPGTEFNYEFWSSNSPRRSTYPACRAVIAARQMGSIYEKKMILAIQQAYYLNARNPSNHSTLVEIADEIGLDQTTFEEILRSAPIQDELLDEIRLSRLMGISSFPGLALNIDGGYWPIPVDYHDEKRMLDTISQISI